MATTLLLIRHAQREHWNSVEDSLCHISSEGQRIQEKMAAAIKEAGHLPNKILYSPPERTKETAKILGSFFNIVPEKEENLGLYGDEEALLKIIPEPSLNQTIFMVGHAPTLMRFANLLTGTICLHGEMKTSSAIVLVFDQEIAFGKAVFMKYLSV